MTTRPERPSLVVKFSLGENVVDKAAVQAAVAILERMNINDPKRVAADCKTESISSVHHAVVCFK